MKLTQNYFELFGLPVAFEIDSQKISESYRALQKVVHPDKFASATEQERRIAMQQASFINEAQQTLKDPVARATYLLSLHGVELNLEKETTSDTMFLMEQLELRERLANVQSESDPFAALDLLISEVGGLNKQILAKISAGFENPTPEKLENVQEDLRKMKFLQKLQHQVEAVEEELDELL
ncbi:MAG: co-chaperone HscB [Candidatus Polarisedimenticolaceae bacterium]|nr:co-chaperone HscB [Candidatus Polarisedimenticolaceae bacterium]